MEFRHSICNEAFEKWQFADACKAIRRIGYTGIEIAPFTLAERPTDVTAAQRTLAEAQAADVFARARVLSAIAELAFRIGDKRP